MAPPIPGLRRAPVQRGRSAGDVLAGILAILALIVLTAGVPLALLRLFGSPIPHTMPSTSGLTHQLDSQAVLKVLAIVVWLAWLQLVVCIIAEVRAAVRNTGMPARIPLAGGTQSVAHRLVTAAVLLFTAAAALSPAFAHQAPPRAAHSISAAASQGAGTQDGQSGPDAAAVADRRPDVEKIYVVRPPVGRYHQSLWEIAQDHLGDGRRYPEIFEMNKDRIQPDGSKLTIASLIRPGWVLHMPRDAHGPGIEIVRRGTDDKVAAASDSGRGAAGYEASSRAAAAATAAIAAAEQADGAGAGHRPLNGSIAPGQPAGGLSGYPIDLVVASLLAAGLLAALGRRRREQLWQRGFGRRVVAPAGEAGLAEAALRLGASEQLAARLDTGLRQLSRTLSDQGRTLPNVFAAHLGDAHLDLSISPADQDPPAPWSAISGGQVWRLPFAAIADASSDGAAPGGAAPGGADLDGAGPDDAGRTLAPFPGLVSIGTDDAGRVLVDLEAAQGLIAVTGPQPVVQAALAAIATELATNRWSDQMQVILVGFGDELTMIAPERVTAADSLADVLPGLEARAAMAQTALTGSGADSVLTGRCRGIQPQACAPHYLIMATPPAPEEQDRLLALARTRHRTAAGYVVAGDVTGATWTWEVSEEGRLQAGVLGFDVQAQLLPARQYAAVIELFRAAAQTGGEASTVFAVNAAPAAQLAPGARMAVEITLLGPVAVQAPGEIEPDRAALATELAVYLAAHPGGVHLNVLTGAVWPRGVTALVRDAALARTATWLGDDAAGRPNLITDAEGRLRLGPGVRVDWHVFQALVAHAAQEASRGGQAEISYLRRALAEVSGRLLDGRGQGKYTWLATDGLEYEAPALVADAAHRLSGLLRAAGDPQGAMEAARAGLALADSDEMLWRDLLLAAELTGDEQLLADVVAEVCARTAQDKVMPRMAPETESLIDELLPSWRSSVA